MSIKMIIGKEVYESVCVSYEEECLLGGTSFGKQWKSEMVNMHTYTEVFFCDAMCIVPCPPELDMDFVDF